MQKTQTKSKLDKRDFSQLPNILSQATLGKYWDLYFFLKSHSDSKGNSYNSNEFLALSLNKSISTIKRHRKFLEENGFLQKNERKNGRFNYTNKLHILDLWDDNKHYFSERGGGGSKLTPMKYSPNTYIKDNVLAENPNSLSVPMQHLDKKTMPLMQKGETLASPMTNSHQSQHDTHMNHFRDATKMIDQIANAGKPINKNAVVLATSFIPTKEGKKTPSSVITVINEKSPTVQNLRTDPVENSAHNSKISTRKSNPTLKFKTKFPLTAPQQKLYDDIKAALPTFDHDSLCVEIRTKLEKDLRDTLFHLKHELSKGRKIPNRVGYFRFMIDKGKFTSVVEENRIFVKECKEKYGWHDLEIKEKYAKCPKFSYEIEFESTTKKLNETLKNYNEKWKSHREKKKYH